ncbi:retrovirus-related pol polyprotein from transposon TNT 1-94 [Tanacetum coccineum]
MFTREVISFFKNLRETFKFFEKSLNDEVKEMKDIFKQIEDEVDQCSMAKKCFEIEKKQLLINNDRLLEENISCDIMCTYLRSLNKVDNYGKCKSLDIVLLDQQETNKSFSELKIRFEKLEEYNIALELSLQHNKEKNNLIQKIEDENVSVAFQVSSLLKEREHLKLVYKNLYDSIKQTRAKTKLQTDSLQQKLHDQIYENNKLRAQLKETFYEYQLNQNSTSVNTKFAKPPTSGTKLIFVTPFPKSQFIPKVVKKNDLSKIVTLHLTTNKIINKCTKVLAPGLLKEPGPINAYFKKNRVVHRDYLKVTKEHVPTLHELLEEARALKPLDEHIGHASKFAERIQELLVYVSASCPFTETENEKWAPATSHRKNNKPYVNAFRIKETIETITQKHAVKQNTNNTTLPSTRRNSANVCLSCNECLCSENHDACVVKYLKDVQKDKKAKSVKQKEKIEWKTTDWIFKTIGLKWIPTCRTFNLVDEPCPKLSLRCAKAEESLSRSFLNFNIHLFNPYDFGFERMLSNEELPPWKQFCDSDLEVAFRKHTCFVRNLEGVDLLSGSRGSNLYTISMDEMMKSSPICLLSKASKTKSWLWHRCLSHLNFGTINQLAKQVSTIVFVATLPPPDTVGASSSTSINQDAPSKSTSPNNETTTSQINSTNVEEPNTKEDSEFDSDTFTNSFAPLVTSSAESSLQIVDTSNMHTFQQPQINTRRWTKDHSLVIIISNPSKPVSTRRQLATDAL